MAVSHLLSRWIGALELAAGALAWLAVLALAFAYFEPLFSSIALWPLLGGIAALSVVAYFLGREWAAGALLALAAVPSFVLFVPLVVLDALKVEDGAVEGVLILLLLLGSLLPQLLVIMGRVAPEAGNQKESTETSFQEQPLH